MVSKGHPITTYDRIRGRVSKNVQVFEIRKFWNCRNRLTRHKTKFSYVVHHPQDPQDHAKSIFSNFKHLAKLIRVVTYLTPTHILRSYWFQNDPMTLRSEPTIKARFFTYGHPKSNYIIEHNMGQLQNRQFYVKILVIITYNKRLFFLYKWLRCKSRSLENNLRGLFRFNINLHIIFNPTYISYYMRVVDL